MNPSKFCFSLFFLIVLCPALFAQRATITGRVLDAQTQAPIPHTEVFISGTTLGCITDSAGYFELKIPFLPCTLVADHIAYESYIYTLQNTEKLLIKLEPRNFDIHEVEVSGKNRRKRNLRFFYSHFIEEYREKIKILNDSTLIFERDDMHFTARSNEPLIIENNYLGYRIKLFLDEFTVTSTDGPNGEQIPLNSMNGGYVTKLKGYHYYEPMENEKQLKQSYFENNRRLTYYGSYRHFLKSIYNNDPGAEGYKIKIYPENIDAAFYQIEEKESINLARQYIILADTLAVQYRFDDDEYPIPAEFLSDRYHYNMRKSFIYSTKQPFTIRSNGTSPDLNFIIQGRMDKKNFANSLPDDYTPPKR
ncbi:carboxypeptidase-like regulatory domain-containing protein [Draconibacterium sp. IB214405]|uniref:carboxypeptidase-like regulatory domain-containing protein n=1 Tax=Draconibacterium sp. IB214405 TaxID=3097352 RepID=UPI002A16BA77|nr:carboxypeptidase-like regulatory domain-containing protein [Draconibacterium sp. IB214405]MDX8341520.1 carboxypeptidase-like regulatory domain-containing protein [Draconibacterium sp. IB214405]